MRQDAQKLARKFCAQKTAEKNKTHPKSSKKGETGCVLGAGGGSSGWRRMRADGKGRSEQGRGGRLLLSLAKMEGRTCPACRLGRFAARGFGVDVGGDAAGSGGAARLRSSPSQVTKERCWFGAASYFWRRIVYRLPLLPSKEKHLRQEDGQADQDHGRVGPGSVQLRHRVEIHAVPTSN